MKPPFKISGGGAGTNVNAPVHQPAPPPGKAAINAAKSGRTLVKEGNDIGAPPYDVGGTEPDDEDSDQGPEHKPAIPWPPARAVSRTPFKLGK